MWPSSVPEVFIHSIVVQARLMSSGVVDERSAAIQQYRKKYLEERKLEVRLKQRKSNALTVCCLSVSHECVCAFSVSYLCNVCVSARRLFLVLSCLLPAVVLSMLHVVYFWCMCLCSPTRVENVT